MGAGPPPVPDLCPPFPAVPPIPEVTFPGGTTLKGGSQGDEWPSALALATSLLEQAGPVMGGLSPFFKILDVVIKIFESIKATVESITQLNPEPLISSIVELSEAIAEVVKLIPQLSLPVMIVGLIDLIITFLQGISAELSTLADLQGRVDALQEVATAGASARLQEFVDCLNADVQDQSDALNAAMGPIGQILEVMNLLTQLAGLPELPIVPNFADPAAGAQALEDFVEILTSIRDAIPI